MSEVIWKIFMNGFPVGLGYKVVAELVMMNIYCFLFVFSLLRVTMSTLLITSNQWILFYTFHSDYLYLWSRIF